MIVEPINEWNLKPEMLAYIHGLIIHSTNGASYKVKVGRLIEIAQELENTAYGDVFQRASQYADIVLKHKPFSKGTKQTALAVALLYLRLNYIVLDDDEILVKSINDLEAKTIDRVTFAKDLLSLATK